MKYLLLIIGLTSLLGLFTPSLAVTTNSVAKENTTPLPAAGALTPEEIQIMPPEKEVILTPPTPPPPSAIPAPPPGQPLALEDTLL